MTNVLPPLNQPTIDIGSSTGNFTGSIDNAATNINIGNLSVGQQITVQINPQSLTQIGNNFLFNLDLSLPDINGNTQTVTAAVELPPQLKLPPQTTEMQIRIIAHTSQKLDFRIINIAGKPTSSLVLPTESFKSVMTNSSVIADNTLPTVINIQKHPLLPLKLQPLVEQIITQSPLSSRQVAEFTQSLPDFRIKTEITQVQPQPAVQQPQTASVTVSSAQFSQLPPEIADKLAQTVQNLLQNIVPTDINTHQPMPSNAVLPQTTQQFLPLTASSSVYSSVEQILQQLVGRELPAQVIEKGELKVLQTPLGEIIPELPLKLEVGDQLLLKISELIIPHEDNKVAKIYSPITNKIIDIIKPLQGQIIPEVFTALIEKIPTDNPKMLSNIISFLKAAASENIVDWLGGEIVENLRLSGLEGQESLNRLESLLIGRKEENSQWRIIEVPFYDTENLRQIRVAIRKYTKEGASRRSRQAKPDAARFVIDTTFTALGAFQFDGFSIAKDKRFDLIIRTEKDISEDFCSQIMCLFRNSLSAVDYAGNIRINIKEKFIKLCEDNSETTILQDGLYI
ncbi:MAG: hypothetical protein IJX20_03345 [Alphaproteobacteria bacterium]|nr:hypothetical protein [Alphaproteobacteria bacterium]